MTKLVIEKFNYKFMKRSLNNKLLAFECSTALLFYVHYFNTNYTTLLFNLFEKGTMEYLKMLSSKDELKFILNVFYILNAYSSLASCVHS